MKQIIAILSALTAAGIGVVTWPFGRRNVDNTRVQNASEAATAIIAQAEEDKRELILGAQEEALRKRTEAERELQEQRQEFNRIERRHLQREEQLDRKVEAQETNNSLWPKKSPRWKGPSKRSRD